MKTNKTLKFTTEIYPSIKGSKETLTLVKYGEDVIGFVTKFKDTKYDTNPHKAYLGTGEKVQALGHYWKSLRGLEFAGDDKFTRLGGKAEAVQAVCSAYMNGGQA